MKEHPILFSTPMVDAITALRKTMTRRICKYQTWSFSELNDVNSNGITQKKDRSVSCPYGQVGDVLWVREEHLLTFEGNFWTIEYRDGTTITLFYKKLSADLNKRLAARKTLGKWQRSRFLPKELSRIWLKITSIKVERLQEISSREAIHEGIENLSIASWKDYISPLRYCSNPRDSFCSLWISINGNESWEADPWVWAIEFEVLSTTGKPAAL